MKLPQNPTIWSDFEAVQNYGVHALTIHDSIICGGLVFVAISRLKN